MRSAFVRIRTLVIDFLAGNHESRRPNRTHFEGRGNGLSIPNSRKELAQPSRILGVLRTVGCIVCHFVFSFYFTVYWHTPAMECKLMVSLERNTLSSPHPFQILVTSRLRSPVGRCSKPGSSDVCGLSLTALPYRFLSQVIPRI